MVGENRSYNLKYTVGKRHTERNLLAIEATKCGFRIEKDTTIVYGKHSKQVEMILEKIPLLYMKSIQNK